jgi:2-phospho-L-lactate transferase/gluconeogenesis factor (CofD/UPF0052 family)
VTDPSIGSQLFEYRFTGRGELAGHNLGNLMLLALDNLCVRPWMPSGSSATCWK